MKRPLYRKIYDDLVEKIERGEFQPGDKIPTETEWAKKYEVSRITSKKALDLAADNRLIFKQAGRGSFVTNEARKLIGQNKESHGKTLAIIQPDLSDFFGLETFLNLEKLCHREKFSVLTGISNKSLEKEKELITRFMEYGVDGFIIHPVHNESFNNEILKLIIEGFPIILIDRFLKDISCPNVISKNLEGAYLGMNHLYSLGHKNIGIISRPIGSTSTLQERETGVRNAIMESESKFSPDWWLTELHHLDDKSEENFLKHKAMIREFLENNRELTAVFTLEYSPIPIVEVVAHEMGLKIPEDLSLLSFDSPGHLVNHIKPVTHLQQNEPAIASRAFCLIKKMLEGEKLSSFRHEVDVKLVIGETVAQAKG